MSHTVILAPLWGSLAEDALDGLCCACNSRGYIVVPCPRNDPARLVPDCRWRGLHDGAYPAHDRRERCNAPGCRDAVRTALCPRGDRCTARPARRPTAATH